MTCAEWNSRTEKWLEANGFQITELPQELSEHISQCSACARRFQAMSRLFGAAHASGASQRDSEAPPPDLSARVMDRLRSETGGAKRESAGTRRDRNTARNRGAREERKERERFLSARLPKVAAALLLIALSATVTYFVSRDLGGSAPEVVTVRLELRAPDAGQVSVVGDWNNWDPGANPMSDSDDDGVWVTTIEVDPSQDYLYQFLIDQEEWIPDPDAPIKIDDGFGGTNSVLNI